jgi:hypothetical protein
MYRDEKQWEQEWQDYKGARQNKLFFPRINKAKSKEIMECGRYKAGKIIRFCTGHNALRYHLYNIGVTETAECRFCEERVETSWHIATECSAFNNKRRKITAAKYFQADWCVMSSLKRWILTELRWQWRAGSKTMI